MKIRFLGWFLWFLFLTIYLVTENFLSLLIFIVLCVFLALDCIENINREIKS